MLKKNINIQQDKNMSKKRVIDNKYLFKTQTSISIGNTRI